jgi:TRAP-type uncharacterized transport system substrate-binding protein
MFNWLTIAELSLGGVILLALGVFLYRTLGTRTYKVNMLVDLDPNRAMLAQRIEREALQNGLEVILSEEPYGSLEAIDLVDKPNPIDLALVPGGVALRDYKEVRQVAALSLEPLQLLARPELAAAGVGQLKGRRICLGPTTTTVHFLARDVLAFAGLCPAGAGCPEGYLPETQSPQELQKRLHLLRGLQGTAREQAIRELPDAVFLLSPLPSLLARDLVTLAGYRLMELHFATAYCLDRTQSADSQGVRIDRANFSATEIPAYTYSVDPPVPSRPSRTIGTRLLLIAYAPTDQEAVARLLKTVFSGPVSGLASPQPLREQVPQFPFHPGAHRYMRRNDPLLTPEMLSGLGKAVGGLGAFASGIVAVYGFLRLRQLRRFEAYYKEIRRLELIARGQEIDPAAPTEPCRLRDYLEERLLDLKSRALQDFASGGLRGEGLMQGIVSLVNDTRSSLARLALTQMPTPPAPAAESVPAPAQPTPAQPAPVA